MKNKENLIKKIELANEQAIKDTELLLSKYYANGYSAGRKDAFSTVKHKPCINGYHHTVRLTRSGNAICRKCHEEFILLSKSEAKRVNLVFV